MKHQLHPCTCDACKRAERRFPADGVQLTFTPPHQSEA
jgi:hypothetical protein